MGTTFGLTFIIPAYNEEKGLKSTLERLSVALAALDIPSEITVVNDGSTDGTRAIAEDFPGINVINHPINTGYGSAIKTGILHARHGWIGIVDADGTYDIEQLPLLVDKMRQGFDMVVAARTNVTDLDRPFKRWCRKAFIGVLNVLVAARIVDPNSGFRIFRKEMAMTFFPFLCNTFSFTTSITLFAFGEGYFVTYVPMQYSKRQGKSKVRHFRDSLRLAQLVLQGITFFNPVKFFLILAMLLLTLVSLPAGIFAALGWGSLAAGWLITGVTTAMLVGLGVVGDIIRVSVTTRINKKQGLLVPEAPE